MIDKLIKQTIKDTIRKLIIKNIPYDLIDDYYNGDVFVEDYLNEKQINYLNELQKHLISIEYISFAQAISNSNKVTITTNSDQLYIDTLDSNEFKKQNSDTDNSSIDTYELDYVFYTIKSNDTLESIALKFYGDYKYYTILEKENHITSNDLIDNDMTGVTIKIPIIGDSLPKNDSNLVYYKVKNKNINEIQKFYLGNDIYLNSNNGLEIDFQGDLKIADPIETVVQNINDRISTRRMNLNPLHPSYGINPIQEIHNTPFKVVIKKFIKELIDQIQSDPRVSNVFINEDNNVIVGQNSIEIQANISLITGDVISIRKSIGV